MWCQITIIKLHKIWVSCKRMNFSISWTKKRNWNFQIISCYCNCGFFILTKLFKIERFLNMWSNILTNIMWVFFKSNWCKQAHKWLQITSYLLTNFFLHQIEMGKYSSFEILVQVFHWLISFMVNCICKCIICKLVTQHWIFNTQLDTTN
jgi:hypothetical protein